MSDAPTRRPVVLGTVRAGFLNISQPGNFEPQMASIVDWFAEHPASDAV